MIVFDLQCSVAGHRFEGWFSSSDDFTSQRDRGLIQCPMCGSSEVGKAPTAARLARKGNQGAVAKRGRPEAESGTGMAMAPVPQEIPAEVREAIVKVAKLQAEALKHSDYVGSNFGEEARAIHYGEKDARPIHGQTTPEEARELHEEGVPVAPLLVPFVPPEAKN